MSTSQQLRTRAAEFSELIKPADPDAIRELRRQERTFRELADNEDWLANNWEKTVHPTDEDNGDDAVLAPTASMAVATVRPSRKTRGRFFVARRRSHHAVEHSSDQTAEGAARRRQLGA